MHRLVFIHYLGGSGSEWQGVVDALPRGFDALTIDLPGFGQHGGTSGFDVTSMADHVMATLGGAPPMPWLLIGHSMGAKVSAVLAQRAASGAASLQGLVGLVLVAGSPPAPEPMQDSKRSEMLSWFAGDAARSRREAEGFVDANVARPLASGVRERAVSDVLRAQKDAWRAWLTGGSLEDWRDRIGTISIPTLLVAGSEDEALGPEAQRTVMAPHFSDVRLEVIEEVGHLIPMEHPARLAELISSHALHCDPPLPPGYAAFIRSPRVSAGTRAVLLHRLVPRPATVSVLPTHLLPTLRAAMRRLVPQPGLEPIDLAARFADALEEDAGDGWRYAVLPPDGEAARRGLRTLDAVASTRGGHLGFGSLADQEQDAVLREGMAGALAISRGDDLLDAGQMQLWLEELRAAATRFYIAHPATLARLGYSGIASGGDGSPKIMRPLIGEGERDSWEPLPERHS